MLWYCVARPIFTGKGTMFVPGGPPLLKSRTPRLKSLKSHSKSLKSLKSHAQKAKMKSEIAEEMYNNL